MVSILKKIIIFFWLMSTLRVCVCLCVWSLPVDLALVGAVGVLGQQTAVARALKPGHLAAQEGL